MKNFWRHHENIKLGIIGGSGIYEIDGVQDGQWISVDTPFGAPSDKIYGHTEWHSCCVCHGMAVATYIHLAMYLTAPISVR